LANPATQGIEIGPVGWSRWAGAGAIEEQGAQALSILIPADEFAHLFAAGAETSPGNLFVYIGLECVGKRNVHRAHVSPTAGWAQV